MLALSAQAWCIHFVRRPASVLLARFICFYYYLVNDILVLIFWNFKTCQLKHFWILTQTLSVFGNTLFFFCFYLFETLSLCVVLSAVEFTVWLWLPSNLQRSAYIYLTSSGINGVYIAIGLPVVYLSFRSIVVAMWFASTYDF